MSATQRSATSRSPLTTSPISWIERSCPIASGASRVQVDDGVLEQQDRQRRRKGLDLVEELVVVEELAHFAFLIGIETRIGSGGFFFAAGIVIVQDPRR